MKTVYQYIHFEQISETENTTVWSCRAENNAELGRVGWYNAWRQYCFGPVGVTIYHAGCLIDIADFLKQLNDDHKLKLKRRKDDANTKEA